MDIANVNIGSQELNDLPLSSERSPLTPSTDGGLDFVMLFEWKCEYTSGIPIIDEQHRGLLAALNSLHYAIVNDFGDNMLEPTIEMVKAYALTHFMTEEILFAQHGYPDAEQHAELHRKLTDTIFDVGQESVLNQDPNHFLQFLKNWLNQHIIVEDRKHCEWFKKCGKGAPLRTFEPEGETLTSSVIHAQLE